MKQLLIFSFSFMSLISFAQGWVPMGARSMSMGNASVALSDVWSYHNNPGAVADVEEFAVGVSYENRFLLKELQSQGFSVVVPLKKGVLSVGGQTYGFTDFRTYRVGSGYSMQLSERFFAGVQMNYQGLQLADGYGRADALSGEAGVYAKITDQLTLGASVNNIGRAKLSDFQDDRFSTLMRLGTSYRFSKRVMVALEIEKDLEYNPRLKAGLEYELVKQLKFRGGVGTGPTELSFGMAYQWKQFEIGCGTSYHQLLGWSPHFSLVFQQDKK